MDRASIVIAVAVGGGSWALARRYHSILTHNYQTDAR